MSDGQTARGLARLLAAMFCVVLGMRLWLVARTGHPLPFADEWDAGAGALYSPYLEGRFTLDNLLYPFNEHRFLTSRVLSLVEFELAGGWNPRFQMMISAIIASGIYTWAAALLVPLVPQARQFAFIALCALAFSLPIGFESAIMGMNAHFYFLIGFSLLALVRLVRSPPLSLGWWVGVASSILAYFSMASAALTPLIAICVMLLQLVAGVRRVTWRDGLAALLLLLVAFAMFRFIPVIPHHDALKAHSVWAFLAALTAISALPLATPLGTAFVHAPTVMLVVRTLRFRLPQTHAAWVAIAIAGWVAAQMISIAYNRSTSPLSSRYLDIALLAFPVALGALSSFDIRRPLARWLGSAWLFVLVLTLGFVGTYTSLRLSEGHYETLSREAEVITAFLRTGSPDRILAGEATLSYPTPQVLIDYLTNPQTRSLIPPEFEPDPARTFDRQRLLLRAATRPAVDMLVSALKPLAFLFAALGLALVAIGALRPPRSDHVMAP